MRSRYGRLWESMTAPGLAARSIGRFEQVAAREKRGTRAGKLAVGAAGLERAENLALWLHELDLSQYLGDKLKFLEIVEREVGPRRGEVEALVADLHHS